VTASVCLSLAACGDSSASKPQTSYTAPASQNSGVSTSGETSSESDSEQKGTRDNTPQVLTPSADGVTEYSCDVATIDASNASEGYVMVNYTGENEKVKLQVTGPDGVTQTYNLHGGYEVFPLTAGDGSYSFGVYESVNTQDNKYSTALSENISVTITNTFGPYLYPNQYVNFNAQSLPVAKAEELAYPASSDLDVVTNVYNYIIEHITYDYDKAATVESGYLPDVDEIYQCNTGICFDYAAVMATMLRSQGIPTRLEVGYKGEVYHAWVSIYTEDTGWVNGIIQFDGSIWRLMDPTFASTSNEPEKFITDDDGYLTKYIY
jgi:transglutaminase-like putative cysteine protease